jgi:TctA family transporter
VAGFLKLLVRSAPNDVPVVGDLLPALAGLAMGASLLVQVLREKSDLPGEAISKVEKAALAYRVPLGLAGLAVAVLHFLLPGALFL